jgi:hypothetical protein
LDSSPSIQALNDAFRKTFVGGRVAITVSIQAMPNLASVLDQVQSFNSFDESNDPHGEHDFGSFEAEGHIVFWKLDYHAVDLNAGSPDPKDPKVTTRVLTIMLADEY